MSIYEDLPQGEYSLNKVDIREIVDKYPDKVVDIIDREVFLDEILLYIHISRTNLLLIEY